VGVDIGPHPAPRGFASVHGVVVAAPDAAPLDVPVGDEVVEDRLYGSLRDADVGRDLSEPCIRIACDAEEDLCVV
jgi:hypothetical protein